MDYNKGEKVGLRKEDMDFISQLLETEDKEKTSTLSRFTTGTLVNFMLSYPESRFFIEEIITKKGKHLNFKKVHDSLNYEIDNPFYDPDYGINVSRQQRARDLLENMSSLEETYENMDNDELVGEIPDCIEEIPVIQDNSEVVLPQESELTIQDVQVKEENTQNQMLAVVNETSVFYKVKRFFRNLFTNRKTVESV